jgi:hypothetical protein
MSIDQLERRFRQLKAQLQSGTISQEQYENEVQRLQYRDSRGLYWTVGAQTGQWYVYDGTAWVPRLPPEHPAARGAGAAGMPARRRTAQPAVLLLSCAGLLTIIIVAIAGIFIVRTLANQIARPTPPALSLTTPEVPFSRFAVPSPVIPPSPQPTPTPPQGATIAAPTPISEAAATSTVASAVSTLVVTRALTTTPVMTITGMSAISETPRTPEAPAAGRQSPTPATPTPTLRPTRKATPAPPPPPTDTPTPQPPQPVMTGHIAYAVFGWDERLRDNAYAVFILNADGSGSRKYASEASQPALSRDGTRIAYKSWRTDNAGLMAGVIDGSPFNRLTDMIEDSLPSLSPDGQSVIMFSRRSGDRKSILYPLSANSMNLNARGINDGEYPFWMSDGRIVCKGWGMTGGGLRIMNPDGQGVISLTQDGSDTAPAASADASTIAFMSMRDGNWEIYRISVDGSGTTRLTDDRANDGLPTWSPDGLSIAWVSDRGGQWAIWVMNADGSNQRKLWDMEGNPDTRVPGQPDHVSKGWLEERISWGG